MRYVITLALTSFLLTAANATLVAQKGGSAHGPAKSADTAKAPKTQTHTPATKENGGGKPTTKTATTTSSTSSTSGTTATNNTSTSSTSTGTTGTSTTATTTTPTTTVIKNAKFEQKMKALLPAGTNVNDAAKGFKNWGQFVACAHVARNMNISFADLKAKMTGPTPMSLGQAIQASKTTTSTTTSPTTTTSSTTTASTTSTTPKTSTTTTTAKKPTAATVQAQVQKAESEAAEDLAETRNDHHR